MEAGFRQPDLLAEEPAFARLPDSPTFASSLELARRNQAPCADDPEHRVFDFFAGHWSASTPDGTVAGTNHIEVVLGGAALVERWTSTHGYAGTSLNRLDPGTRTWRQTWVDDQGDVVEFVDGRYEDGAMRFVAHRDGVERRLDVLPPGPRRAAPAVRAVRGRRGDMVGRVRPALPPPAGTGRGLGRRATRTGGRAGQQPDAGADLRRARAARSAGAAPGRRAGWCRENDSGSTATPIARARVASSVAVSAMSSIRTTRWARPRPPAGR